MGMESFKQRLSEYAVLTENTLQQYLPEETEDVVTEAMRYSLLAGGKRLRCALALEFCLALGGQKEDVLPFACALEMVHAYSLIHDDLPCMDDDDMRRGKPSCHIAFGEANALLAGDGLLTKAFEVMAQQSKIPPERTVLAVGVLAQAIGHHGMIGGQRMDLQNEGKEVGIEVIEQTNRLKTGALIIAAAQLGCIAAGADSKMTELAKKYAEQIGLAFQITDDILDCTSSAEVLGKPIGSDAENHKTTYVSVYGLEKAMSIAAEEIQKAKDALNQMGMQERSPFLYDMADYILSRKN